jgi:hypothetical protein
MRATLITLITAFALGLTLVASAGAAPTWVPATTLASSTLGEGAPVVAMDAHGDTVAVWSLRVANSSSPSTHGVVQASVRPAGGPWGPAEPLSDPTLNAGSPVVAIDPAGDAVALFTQNTASTTSAVFMAARVPGGAFGAPVAISDSAQVAESPQVAMDPQGNAVAVWDLYDGTTSRAQTAFRPAGGSFDTATALDPGFTGGNSEAVAIDASGAAVAVWARTTSSTDTEIEASQRPAGGTFGTPVSLSGAGRAFDPDVALDGAGNAVAVWQRALSPGFAAEAGSLSAAGAIGPLHTLSASGTSGENPRVASDAAGDAVAAWLISDGSGNGKAEYATAAPGAAFGPEVDADTSAGGFGSADVAESPSGAAIVVWSHQNVSGQQLDAIARPAGGAFGEPQQAGPSESGALFPDVAIDPAGDGAAVWAGSSSPNFTPEAAGYDATAPTLSGLSVPATAHASAPVAFSVKALDVWSAVTLAWSFGDGSTATGAAPSHTYTATGTHTVTVTATDAVGNTSSATAPIVVSAAAGKPPPLKLKVSLKAAAQRSPALRKQKGVRVKCTTNQAATCTVTATITASAAKKLGIKVGRRVKRVTLRVARATLRHAGSVTLTIKPPRKTLVALEASRRSISVLLRASARTKSGASATARSITVHVRH